MNKRKNIIFVICLSILVSLSIGYSIFSENISIGATSTSQGTFDIVPTCTQGTSIFSSLGYNYTEVGNTSTTCTASASGITFSTTLQYPTAIKYFTVKLTNNGTIPAVISNSNVTTKTAGTITSKTISGNTQNFSYSMGTTNYNTYSNAYGVIGPVSGVPYVVQNTSSSYIKSTDSNFSSYLVTNSSNAKYIKLNKGESLYILFSAEWPDVSSFNYSSGMNNYYTSTATYSFSFTQITKDMK